MMPVPFAGEFHRILSAVLPTLTAVIFVLAGVTPSGIGGFTLVSPFLSVAVVFYWVVTRPSLMPPASVFTVGIIQDILSGGPIGLWALTLLIVQFFSLSERKLLFGQRYVIIWLGFSSILLVAAVTVWIGACVFYGVLLSPQSVMLQGALTIVFYPLISWILTGTLRWMPAED